MSTATFHTPRQAEIRRRMHIITDTENDLESHKSNLLRICGWVNSSSNPTCCWLWEKKLPDGRIVMVGTDTAIKMQAMMSEA